MDDLGFILASYAVTLGVVGAFAFFVLRKAQRYGQDVPREERPWT